ncbi:flagellar hook-basal body complex protein FliE [Anaerocolumna cellulosilytica]|uniref:Flagellar hook-basal body complex protein FliE n=1 Tax=Anaerocolumna cellulosilytica TaxID=433286 RepID=A0A6S6R8I7_9FIRM|nr:flagellar hook-basal body complex protein FliE [Anaerocolumna cellulosilytica]MBB5197037.1 flagellar hook-basal body complex protein FliE [Anaerocolumna cellulosilytica]BCJ95251.1 flagellar hook-basal body complex protein FliE [Anaerocolumna cellulosilytica]
MDVTLLNGISGIGSIGKGNVSVEKTDRNETFEKLFRSALDMVNETNDLTNAAEEAEMAFALGLNNNTYDLQVAQTKATMSLQYTLEVRNRVLDAYKEIMNLQF